MRHRLSLLVLRPGASSPRSAVRHTVAALLVVVITGCYSWGRPAEPARPFDLSSEAQDIRVTRVDGSRVVVRRARIVGDSVVGVRLRSYRQVAIAVTEVAMVETRHPDERKTTQLALGALGGLLVWTFWFRATYHPDLSGVLW